MRTDDLTNLRFAWPRQGFTANGFIAEKEGERLLILCSSEANDSRPFVLVCQPCFFHNFHFMAS